MCTGDMLSEIPSCRVRHKVTWVTSGIGVAFSGEPTGGGGQLWGEEDTVLHGLPWELTGSDTEQEELNVMREGR